ncbi:MAG: hypothetical protein NTY34_02035, partial [Candidatus Omnitrophica bacterium]|nr:hypothetical protein [Candidatus Omnitrophota bacterium]
MKDSFKPIIRVIASIIIAAFLAQDIVWAYPSEGNRNLAVTGLKHDETLNSLKTVMVEKQIDSLGGNTIGKLFLDRKGKRQVKNGIIAVEKEGELSFFYQKGNKYAKLYTKDGHRAAVKVVEGLIIALESGRRIRVKVIEGNDEIRGWGNKSQGGTIYLKRSLLNEEIALYHERREAHYAKHPEELPKGVNAHTFLRGCGKDIRRIVYDEVSTGVLGPKFNAEEVINFLKKALKKDRWNDAEFNLIRDNEAKRLFGLQLLYGEQDNQFTPASND